MSAFDTLSKKLEKLQVMPSNTSSAIQSKIQAFTVLEDEVKEQLKSKQWDSEQRTKVEKLYSDIREQSSALAEKLLADVPTPSNVPAVVASTTTTTAATAAAATQSTQSPSTTTSNSSNNTTAATTTSTNVAPTDAASTSSPSSPSSVPLLSVKILSTEKHVDEKKKEYTV
jgi:hypothetical protein